MSSTINESGLSNNSNAVAPRQSANANHDARRLVCGLRIRVQQVWCDRMRQARLPERAEMDVVDEKRARRQLRSAEIACTGTDDGRAARKNIAPVGPLPDVGRFVFGSRNVEDDQFRSMLS